ncbi:MAG: tyrosine-type recombinase/integrase, partial [Pseudomonadota bacterium]
MSAAAESALPPAAAKYLEQIASQRRLAALTVDAYRRDLQKLAELAGATPLERLVGADLRRFIAKLHGAGLGAASLARTLSAWRSFYRWLGGQGVVGANPALGIRAPKRARPLPKALAPDQAVQLAAHETDGSPLALRDRAMVELLYSSGLRLAELVSVDWRHFPAQGRRPASTSWIDLEASEVTVTGKGGKTRTVPIGTAAVQALRAWLAARAALPRADERALFVSARGARIAPRSVQQRLALLARRLGLGVHVHPHVLRHSMASHVLQSSG